jgi:hypothetical protein
MCLVLGGGGGGESMAFIENFGEETLGRIRRKKGNIKMSPRKADGFI